MLQRSPLSPSVPIPPLNLLLHQVSEYPSITGTSSNVPSTTLNSASWMRTRPYQYACSIRASSIRANTCICNRPCCIRACRASGACVCATSPWRCASSRTMSSGMRIWTRLFAIWPAKVRWIDSFAKKCLWCRASHLKYVQGEDEQHPRGSDGELFGALAWVSSDVRA